ncbi:hypothetical protein GPN2_10135 [Streptomyces murinus]
MSWATSARRTSSASASPRCTPASRRRSGRRGCWERCSGSSARSSGNPARSSGSSARSSGNSVRPLGSSAGPHPSAVVGRGRERVRPRAGASAGPVAPSGAPGRRERAVRPGPAPTPRTGTSHA